LFYSHFDEQKRGGGGVPKYTKGEVKIPPWVVFLTLTTIIKSDIQKMKYPESLTKIVKPKGA
jgi:hypothetical protein